MAGVLSKQQISEALTALPGWAVVDGKLHKELRFRDFSAAFGFMVRVAMAAEKRDHHPDWSNSYASVVIDIVNHAAGGITETCIQLATDIEAAASS